MNNKQIVSIIKLVHSVVFFFMVACLVYIFYCILARRYDGTLLFALAAIIIEGLVLMLNRCTCPFTQLAEKHGAASGSVTDLYVPLWCARHTFKIATTVFIIEVIWLAISYFPR